MKCENPEINYLLMTEQRSCPAYTSVDGKVDLHDPSNYSMIGGYNFACLINTDSHGWCWESGTDSFKPGKGGKVTHNRNVPNPGAINLFCVVPDTVLQTPTELTPENLRESELDLLR